MKGEDQSRPGQRASEGLEDIAHENGTTRIYAAHRLQDRNIRVGRGRRVRGAVPSLISSRLGTSDASDTAAARAHAANEDICPAKPF